MAGSYIQYQGLNDENSIRILKVKHSIDLDSPIHCELVTRSRSQCEPYEALSYCWGPPGSPCSSITINGQSLQVRDNLACALRRLRLRDRTRSIWADAICINQERREEQTNQLKKMDRTYQDAFAVLVWLGEHVEGDNSKLAMKAVRALGSQYVGQSLNEVHRHHLRIPIVEGHGPQEYLPAIRQLLKRDWFRRVWVIRLLHLLAS